MKSANDAIYLFKQLTVHLSSMVLFLNRTEK